MFEQHFELDLYPAQEEGVLYYQMLHPKTELQELTQMKFVSDAYCRNELVSLRKSQ